ncbi:MAG: hypothetical protein ACT4NP_09520 [Pseudonocardiales bacterium]
MAPTCEEAENPGKADQRSPPQEQPLRPPEWGAPVCLIRDSVPVRSARRDPSQPRLLLEESDAYSFEEFVLEWLKPYMKIDVEMLARDSEIELYVAETEDGGVFVFDTRG